MANICRRRVAITGSRVRSGVSYGTLRRWRLCWQWNDKWKVVTRPKSSGLLAADDFRLVGGIANVSLLIGREIGPFKGCCLLIWSPYRVLHKTRVSASTTAETIRPHYCAVHRMHCLIPFCLIAFSTLWNIISGGQLTKIFLLH